MGKLWLLLFMVIYYALHALPLPCGDFRLGNPNPSADGGDSG